MSCDCVLLQAEGTACVADETCSGCTASNNDLDYNTVKECTEPGIRAAFGSLEFLNTTACVAAAKDAQSPLSLWLDCKAADALKNSNCRLNKFCSIPVSKHVTITNSYCARHIISLCL
jgi:hypothetical protein